MTRANRQFMGQGQGRGDEERSESGRWGGERARDDERSFGGRSDDRGAWGSSNASRGDRTYEGYPRYEGDEGYDRDEDNIRFGRNEGRFDQAYSRGRDDDDRMRGERAGRSFGGGGRSLSTDWGRSEWSRDRGDQGRMMGQGSMGNMGQGSMGNMGQGSMGNVGQGGFGGGHVGYGGSMGGGNYVTGRGASGYGMSGRGMGGQPMGRQGDWFQDQDRFGVGGESNVTQTMDRGSIGQGWQGSTGQGFTGQGFTGQGSTGWGSSNQGYGMQGYGMQGGMHGYGMQGSHGGSSWGGHAQSGHPGLGSAMQGTGGAHGSMIGSGFHQENVDRTYGMQGGIGGLGQGGIGGSMRGGAMGGWGQSLGGDRPHLGKGPKGYTRSDDRIREEVCDLLSDGYVDASNVEVDVKGGVITLSGQVTDKQSKRQIEDLVESCRGVKTVENQIRVMPRAQATSGAQGSVGQGSMGSVGQSSGGMATSGDRDDQKSKNQRSSAS